MDGNWESRIKRKYIVFPIIIPLVVPLLTLVIFYIVALNIGAGEWLFEHYACEHNGNNFYFKHCGFRYDVIWLVLTSYITLATLIIYKKRFFQNLDELHNVRKRNIIVGITYRKTLQSLQNRKFFVVLLIIFEILFFIAFWSPCKPTELPCPKGFPTGIISYLVISITAIPIGAACIVALFTSVFFPWYVSRYTDTRIKVFHPDRRGGLAPIIELLYYATSIFSGGLVISVFLFPELYLTQERLVAYGLFFILFDLILFFAPQIFIQKALARKKMDLLKNVHEKISYWLDKLIAITDPERSGEEAESYSQNSSPYQNTRDEINRMNTWPLDINTLKFTLQLSLTITSMILIQKGLTSDTIIKALQDLLK